LWVIPIFHRIINFLQAIIQLISGLDLIKYLTNIPKGATLAMAGAKWI